MELECKSCGGNVGFCRESNSLKCEFCGAEQSLYTVFDAADSIYKNEGTAAANVNTYRRAFYMMKNAAGVDSLNTAAAMFERLGDILDSADKVKECREKAEILKREQSYQAAVADMESEDPEILNEAKNLFIALGDYKDAAEKSRECDPLIKNAEKQREIRLAAEAAERAKQKRKKITICLAAVIIVFVLLIGRGYIYSAKRYDFEITPQNQNYLTEKGSNYEFLYAVEIKNNGLLDVAEIECEITFEKDGEVIADTVTVFSNYSSAALRAGKKVRYDWILSTSSDYIAEELYYNFDDLDIKVKVTEIRLKNGKSKTY